MGNYSAILGNVGVCQCQKPSIFGWLTSQEAHDSVPGLGDGWWSAERVVTDQTLGIYSLDWLKGTFSGKPRIFDGQKHGKNG